MVSLIEFVVVVLCGIVMWRACGSVMFYPVRFWDLRRW